MRWPIIQQHDTNDCGPACLAMVARYHGSPQPIAVLRDRAGTDRHGTSLMGLVRAAEAIGFRAKGVRASREALSQVQLPAIAHWSEGGRNHFVVLFKTTKTHATIGDPAQGLRRLALDAFERCWTGVLVLLQPTPDLKELADPSMRKLWHLLRPHRFLFGHALLAGLLVTVLGLSLSFFIQILVDSVLVDGRPRTLNWLGVGMLLVLLVRVGLQGLQAILLAHLGRKIDTSVALGYHHHLLGLPLQFFWTRRPGEILSRLGEAAKIRAAVSGTGLWMIVDSVTLGVTILAMLWLHWTIALVAISSIPILTVAVWALTGRLKRAQRTAMEKAALFESHAVDAIGAIESIKAFRAEDQLRQRGELRFGEMVQAGFQAQVVHLVSSTTTLGLTGLAGLVLLWLGGHEVMGGGLTVGRLMALYTLFGMITGPIERLAAANHTIQDAFVAAERIGDVLSLPTEREREANGAVARSIQGRVEFRNVRFQYGQREPVFDGLNLTVEPGEICAIAGPSGSGKSTVVRLLTRFVDPNGGQILVDDLDIRSYRLEDLRRQVVTVGQEASLLNASVAENIRLGRPEAQPEQIFEASRLARVDTFVDALPRAYDSPIGERGLTLSGGERQRIALARAILMDAPVLVLDEPLNHLDPPSAEAVAEIIDRRRRARRTTIVISHAPVPVDRTIELDTRVRPHPAVAT